MARVTRVAERALLAGGGWLRAARRAPSPNCDHRPPGVAVEVAVIHGISLPPGHFGSGRVADLFRNRLDWNEHAFYSNIRGLCVSSHVLIERNGSLVQFVALHRRAWHAGESTWRGRPRVNDFSVGIELEGADDVPYEDAQYAALAAVLTTLRGRFPALTARGIVGHCHVSPGRKTDPGPAFDWARLARDLGLPAGWRPDAAP